MTEQHFGIKPGRRSAGVGKPRRRRLEFFGDGRVRSAGVHATYTNANSSGRTDLCAATGDETEPGASVSADQRHLSGGIMRPRPVV